MATANKATEHPYTVDEMAQIGNILRCREDAGRRDKGADHTTTAHRWPR